MNSLGGQKVTRKDIKVPISGAVIPSKKVVKKSSRLPTQSSISGLAGVAPKIGGSGKKPSTKANHLTSATNARRNESEWNIYQKMALTTDSGLGNYTKSGR